MTLPASESQAAAAAGTAAPPAVPSHFQSFVSFDFGAKRTG
jgi:putative Holliday junction resolvase